MKSLRTIESRRFRPYKAMTTRTYRVWTWLLRGAFAWVFNLHGVHKDQMPKKGPVLLLANHQNLMDPPWVGIMAPRHVSFVATENVFRTSLLSGIIRYFGGFPTRKGSQDTSAMRNIVRLLRDGLVVGIYPEGIRTWDGLTSPINPTIASLVKVSKAAVVCCRLEGAYLALPRWASKYRRVPVRGVFKRLYDAGGAPSDKEQILRDISAFLRSREYELKFNEKRYRRSGLAVNITTLLYRCPNCGALEGLKVAKPLKTNRIQCANCSACWRVTLCGRLVPLDENGRELAGAVTWAECYKRIRDLPLYPIRANRALPLAEGEELYLASGPMLLQTEARFPVVRDLGRGQMYLTSHRFFFLSSGGPHLVIPLVDMKQIATDPGGQFYFTFAETRYLIVIRTESVLKWYDILMRLRAALPPTP